MTLALGQNPGVKTPEALNLLLVKTPNDNTDRVHG